MTPPIFWNSPNSLFLSPRLCLPTNLNSPFRKPSPISPSFAMVYAPCSAPFRLLNSPKGNHSCLPFFHQLRYTALMRWPWAFTGSTISFTAVKTNFCPLPPPQTNRIRRLWTYWGFFFKLCRIIGTFAVHPSLNVPRIIRSSFASKRRHWSHLRLHVLR